MKDDNGEVILHHEFEYNVLGRDHFQTIENGVTYDIQYGQDEVTVTRGDGETVKVSIGGNTNWQKGVLSRDLLPMLKGIPGSFYFDIDKYGLTKIGMDINSVRKNNAHYSPGENLIAISNERSHSNFTEAHEHNHFVIHHVIAKNIETPYTEEYKEYAKTPGFNKDWTLSAVIRSAFRILYLPEECPDAEAQWNFLQENFPKTFDAISKSVNTDLLETYVEERRQMLRNQTSTEVRDTSYFLESTSYRRTDILCSMEEMASDVRGFLYASSDRIRAEHLQKYFPKTFAMMANMILGNTEYTKFVTEHKTDAKKPENIKTNTTSNENPAQNPQDTEIGISAPEHQLENTGKAPVQEYAQLREKFELSARKSFTDEEFLAFDEVSQKRILELAKITYTDVTGEEHPVFRKQNIEQILEDINEEGADYYTKILDIAAIKDKYGEPVFRIPSQIQNLAFDKEVSADKIKQLLEIEYIDWLC